MADVYTNTDNDFPGAPERSRPGSTPGEEGFGTVVDADGRRVSDKPANKAIIKGRADRLEHEKKAEAARKAREAGGGSSVFSRLFLLAIFLPLLSQFIVGNFHFSLAPTVKNYAREAWRHPSNPFGPKLITFTTPQLALYDGSDPSKPLYLAISGEVFDVSANPRIYGKGGSYNMMTGRDASRAFITGCFQTHLTHDLRGLSEKEIESLAGWTKFFKNSDKYFQVGNVILPSIDKSSPIPKPCNVAAGDEAPAHHKKGQHARGGTNPHGKSS